MKPHWPLSQTALPLVTPGQTVPQPPQLATSEPVLTQLPPHFVKPALQMKPHTLEEHVAEAFAGALHWVPQMPQLDGSLWVLTHWPEQLVWPVPHTSVQTPLAQTCSEGQALLQSPQWSTLDWTLTQLVPHLVKPELQVLPHVPPEQVALPFRGAGQMLPQEPQLLVLEERLTQLPAQLV